MGLSQTSAIAGALIIAFIVFITVKGELPCYLEVLGISTGGQCAANMSCGGSSGVTNLLGIPSGSSALGTAAGAAGGILGGILGGGGGGL